MPQGFFLTCFLSRQHDWMKQYLRYLKFKCHEKYNHVGSCVMNNMQLYKWNSYVKEYSLIFYKARKQHPS